MSQLTRLQQALITVILDYNDHQFPPKTKNPETNIQIAKKLADKPVREMYIDLQAIISNFVNQDAARYKHNQSGRGSLLQYILYNIVTMGVFFTPLQAIQPVQADKQADMPSSPVSPELQLLNEGALITENDLIAQLVLFVSNVQQLLSHSTSDECEILYSSKKVKIYGFKGDLLKGYVTSTFCDSGEFLRKALFTSLGLEIEISGEELKTEILERVKEHQILVTFPQVVAELEKTSSPQVNFEHLVEQQNRLREAVRPPYRIGLFKAAMGLTEKFAVAMDSAVSEVLGYSETAAPDIDPNDITFNSMEIRRS